MIKKPLFTCPGRHISGWFILSENWRSQTCPERWGHLTSHRAMKLPLPTHPLISERSAPASLTLEGMPHPLLRAKLALSHDFYGSIGSTWYVMAVSPADPEPCPWVLGMTMNGEWYSLNICWHTKTGCVGEGLVVQEWRPEFRSLEPILKNQGWQNTPIIPAVGRQRHEHHLTSQARQPSWIRGSSRFSEGSCLNR